MSKHSDDQLLNDLLSDGIGPGEESASLEMLLSETRRVRRRRRVTHYRFASVLAIVVVAQISLSLGRLDRPSTAALRNVEAASLPQSPPAETPAIPTITDEELFALFPGRQLALIGPRGDQRLVFLDGR
jgi:hypothetical protein